MALEYGTFAIGGVVYPLTSATANTLLQDADPALYYAIQYFKDCITTHLSGRYAAQAALAQLASTTIIGSTFTDDPAPYMKEDAFIFPLLAVYRMRSTWSNRTVQKRHRESTWKILYTLPPLSVAQVEQMQSILADIGPVLDNRTEQGFDPNVESGALVWHLSGIESIEIQDEQFGKWADAGNLIFPSVELTLIVKELIQPVVGAFSPLAGINVNEDVASTSAATLADVVVFKTDT